MTEKMFLMAHISIKFFKSMPPSSKPYVQHVPQVQLQLFPQRDTGVNSEDEHSMLVSPPSHPKICRPMTIKHNLDNFQ